MKKPLQPSKLTLDPPTPFLMLVPPSSNTGYEYTFLFQSRFESARNYI